MKKSIIALAVAASTMASVAQADGTTLYGRLAYSYDYTKNQGAPATSNVRDRGSRIGVRGSNDLGNGLSAVYDMQFRMGGNAVDSGVRNRRAMVGLTGGFGTFAIGKMGLPYDDVATYSDDFNALGYNDRVDLYGTGIPSNTGNAIAYISPDFSGFSFTAAVVANGGGSGPVPNVRNHVDAYQVTAAYNANGIYAGLGYMHIDSLADTNVLTLGLGYETDVFGVKLNAERRDDNGSVNPVSFNLAGYYNINEANVLRLGYSKLDYDVAGLPDDDTVAVGYQYNFSNTTRAWAEYSHTDRGTGFADTSRLSLGLRTDF